MTEREALKLALKALEAAYARLVTKCEQNLVTYNGVDVDTLTLSQEAITAIKEALAQPEQEPVGDFYITKDMAEHIKKLEVDWTICASGSKRPTEKKVVPVFVGNTTPPQRKPLTDEKISDAVREADFDWHYGWTLDDEEPNRFTKFARAIEAAHGIKGEA